MSLIEPTEHQPHQANHSLTTGNNPWEMNISGVAETMPHDAEEAALELIARWVPLFPGADTWVAKTHGIPSLIVRVDGVVNRHGNLEVYEIEDRPAGIGTTAAYNPVFADRLARVQQTWPAFRSVASPERATDDAMVFGEQLTLEQALDYDGLVLVRSRPEDTAYHCLEPRSISTVTEEGNKSYGVTLGLWHEVSLTEDGFTPKLTGPCVFKPRQGTRAHYLATHMPAAYREELRERIYISSKDCDSEGQLRKLVRQQPGAAMYCQPFIEPMRLAHQPDHNAIYREFFGFDLEAGSWKPLGGMWVARKHFIIHGKEDALFGPLLPSD